MSEQMVSIPSKLDVSHLEACCRLFSMRASPFGTMDTWDRLSEEHKAATRQLLTIAHSVLIEVKPQQQLEHK